MIRKFIKKLGPTEQLRACYEAGPTGFVLYWQLAQSSVECAVVVPTLVPKKPGDRVKTDRRDALKLAHRNGDLTAVWVPDEGSEALRDLVRQREAAKRDQLRARHRLTLGAKAWTERFWEWIQQVHYTQPEQEATFLDCLSMCTGSEEIFVSDTAGHDQKQLTRLDHYSGTPRWSPDSKLIAFDSYKPGGHAEIDLVEPDGRNLHSVISTLITATTPKWVFGDPMP